MSDSLEEWYDKNISVTPEEAIKSELDRVKDSFRDFNGDIMPQSTDISIGKQICSVAIGKAVAHEAKKIEESSIKNSELYEKIDDSKKNIRANISNLKKNGYLTRKDQGVHEINYAKLSEVLDYINGEES